ncbi:hypothetical protein [Providencia stuartii]
MDNKYKCPECGSAIRAWADLDSTLTFEINKNGKLVKRQIKNSWQTDGRCGVECTKCDWILYADSNYSEYPHFEDLALEALGAQSEIHLLTIKKRV